MRNIKFDVKHAVVGTDGSFVICADVVGIGMVIIERSDLTSLFDKDLLEYKNWRMIYRGGQMVPAKDKGGSIIGFNPLIPKDQGFDKSDSMTHQMMMRHSSVDHNKLVIETAVLIENIIQHVKASK